MTATQIKLPPATQRKAIVFALGSQAYALPLEAVREVLPMAQLSQPPGMPSLLSGFLGLGGASVAVINLSRMFGLPEPPWQLYSPLLALRDTQLPVALAVERVFGVISISPNGLSPLGDQCAGNNCAEGVVLTDHGPVILLTAARILLDQERTRLAELQAAHRARLDALQEAGR